MVSHEDVHAAAVLKLIAAVNTSQTSLLKDRFDLICDRLLTKAGRRAIRRG